MFNYSRWLKFCKNERFIFLFCFRYECIENDLLGALGSTICSIAPYQSKGIEKAEELSTPAGR